MESDALLLQLGCWTGRNIVTFPRRLLNVTTFIGAAIVLVTVFLLALLPFRAGWTTWAGWAAWPSNAMVGVVVLNAESHLSGTSRNTMLDVKRQTADEAEKKTQKKIFPGLEMKPDEFIWEVVQEFVNVRSHKSIKSKVVDFKKRCAIFIGKREGAWVKLRNGGYVKIFYNKAILVRLVTARYESFFNGSCADHGQFLILDAIQCQVAALSLKVSNTTMKLTLQASLPAGCYLSRGNQLWLSNSTDANGNSAMRAHQAICSSWYRCHPRVTST